MIHKADYIRLGLTCANVCEALNRRIDKGQMDRLSQSFLDAIELVMCRPRDAYAERFPHQVLNQDYDRDP